MPVGPFLHGSGQRDQRVIRSWSADDLQCNRHGTIIEPGRYRDGGKTEKVGKAGPAAELVKRLGLEVERARIALRNGWCPYRQDGHCDGLGIFKHFSDKFVRYLRSRRDI